MKVEFKGNLVCATGVKLNTALSMVPKHYKWIVFCLWPAIWFGNKIYHSFIGRSVRVNLGPLWRLCLAEKSKIERNAEDLVLDIRCCYGKRIGRWGLIFCMLIILLALCVVVWINLWIWGFYKIIPVLTPFYVDNIPGIGPVDPFKVNALFLILSLLSWPLAYFLFRFIVSGSRKFF